MSLKGFAIPSLFSLVRSCMMCPESPLSSAHSLAGWELKNNSNNFDFICSTRLTPVLMRWLVKRIVWWWTSTLQTWHRTTSLTLSWSATYQAKAKGINLHFAWLGVDPWRRSYYRKQHCVCLRSIYIYWSVFQSGLYLSFDPFFLFQETWC